jgi:hypothetical protein
LQVNNPKLFKNIFVYFSLIGRQIPTPVANTGFLQAADANNLIVIFPQAKFQLWSIGCFDIFGYTSPGSNAYGKVNIYMIWRSLYCKQGPTMAMTNIK